MTSTDPTPAPDANAPALLADRIARAIEIATGRVPPVEDDEGTEITGAKKDLNAKGRGPIWYRMVLRNGSWQYVSSDRLPSGTFRASDRRATTMGMVYPGEIVAGHDHASPVDCMYLVCYPGEDGKWLVKLEFSLRRNGRLAVKLPNGEILEVANPRAK